MSLEQIAATDRSAGPHAAKTDLDRVNKTVSIPSDMPPRIAVWRASLGCTQPPDRRHDGDGEAPSASAGPLKPPNFDDRAWPMGDRQVPELPAAQKSNLMRGGQGIRPELSRRRGGVVRWQDRRRTLRGKLCAHAGAGPTRCARVCGHGGRRRREEGSVDIHKNALAVAPPGDPRGQITLNDMLHWRERSLTEAAGDSRRSHTGGAAPRAVRPPSTIGRAGHALSTPGRTRFSVRAVGEPSATTTDSGRSRSGDPLKTGMTIPETG